MRPSAVPQSGSLSLKVIRACPTHAECALECPERPVEDLGRVAGFDRRSRLQQWKENYRQWRHSVQTPAKP
jgi:hypothetical protein